MAPTKSALSSGKDGRTASRLPLPLTSTANGNSQSHDLWLEVQETQERTRGYAAVERGSVPRRQAQQQVAVGKKLTDKERKEYLAELRRQRERASAKPLWLQGPKRATNQAKASAAKDKPASVGSVGTGFVYALTCPQGKKYVGKTARTLTNRSGVGPIEGCELIREAIAKNGGISVFKTEVRIRVDEA